MFNTLSASDVGSRVKLTPEKERVNVVTSCCDGMVLVWPCGVVGLVMLLLSLLLLCCCRLCWSAQNEFTAFLSAPKF